MPPYSIYPVLLVDDEAASLEAMDIVLRLGGIDQILTCRDGREVLPLLAHQPVSCVLLDLQMPHLSGQVLLEQIKVEYPDLAVIIVTGYDDVDVAVACMKKGAVDYLVKPVESNHLLAVVRRVVELHKLQNSYNDLRDAFLTGHLRRPDAFSAFDTRSPLMQAVFVYLEAVASSPEPVFIVGETGTGKELVAQTLHRLSQRSGCFVAVNLSGVDEQVFSDTLFGHEKGAFTDAREARSGLVREAEGGTLFLDEIGDLSNGVQVKLLRFLQENEYRPLGSDRPRPSQVRVVAATNAEPEELLARGQMRKDLYHRLSVHRLKLPPLRERLEDLPLLVDRLLDQAAQKMGQKKPLLPNELIPLLSAHSFPGNIRELRARLCDALATQQNGYLSMTPFRDIQGAVASPVRRKAAEPGDSSLFFPSLPTLKEAETLLIDRALEIAAGNQARAARILGITRQALSGRLQYRKASSGG